MRIVRVVFLVVCLAVAPALAAGQATIQAGQPPEPPPPTGVLTGIVVDSNGDPVEGAIVRLRGGFAEVALQSIPGELPGGPRSTRSRAGGLFLFSELSEGAYSLDVSKTGYLPGAFGRRRPGGAAQSIPLAAGERKTAIKIQLWAFSAITGSVVDEAGEPMVGVQVQAMRRVFEAGYPKLQSPGVTSATNDRGEFRIDGLMAGSYAVCIANTPVALPTSLIDKYVQAAADGTVNQFRQQIGAFSGNGTPMPAAAGLRLGDVIVQGGASRLPAILVGDDGRTFTYPTTCYPSGVPAINQRVDLEPGAEKQVTLQLSPQPAAQVSGTVVGPDGPIANVALRLIAGYTTKLTGDSEFETAIATSDQSGAFRFVGVPVGDYTLRVVQSPDPVPNPTSPGAVTASSDPAYWASVPVAVTDKGIADLEVRLQRGFRVTGRLEFDGASPKPPPEMFDRFGVHFAPAEGNGGRQLSALRGTISRDGQILMPEMPPGRYIVWFTSFANDRLATAAWETRGATIGGRDASNTPFELKSDETTLVVTRTDRPATIAGTARTSQGQPDADAAVLMFPADPDRWKDYSSSSRLLRQVRAAESGGYRIRGVPEGDYFVVAIPESEAVDWQDPTILAALARTATRVTIGRYDQKTVDPVTTTLPRGGR